MARGTPRHTMPSVSFGRLRPRPINARAALNGPHARNPKAIQGTVRAIWESLDMTRSTALQNGMAYTHIGNQGNVTAMGEKRPTTHR